MVFNTPSPRANFYTNQSNLQVGAKVGNFEGQIWYDGANILGLNPNQFMYLKNMEYGTSGSGRYVQTREGNKLLLDLGAGYRSFGGSLLNDTNNTYFIFVSNSGNIVSIDIDSFDQQTLANNVFVGSYNDSFAYALTGLNTIYLANEKDGIGKVVNKTYSSVFNKPMTSICFSNMSGRMLAASGHTVWYSNVQNQTALDTSNLETFYTPQGVAQNFIVNPSEGQKINKIRDNGEATFFFKDTGIWALINANDDPANWIVPKCNADTGTLSPETVAYGNYGSEQGFFYLGADKTLRLFNGHVVRNAGTSPTLEGGDSKKISFPFQKLLDDIPDIFLSKCSGFYFNGFYVLNIVSSTNNDIDTTIVIDTDKLFQMEGTDIAQPFWYLSDDALCFTNTFVNKSTKLYGINTGGYLCEIFTPGQRWDEVPVRITPNKNYIIPHINPTPTIVITLPKNEFTFISTNNTTDRLSSDIVTEMNSQGLSITQIGYVNNATGGTTNAPPAFTSKKCTALMVLNTSDTTSYTPTLVSNALNTFVFLPGWNGFSKLTGATYTLRQLSDEINTIGTNILQINAYLDGAWSKYDCVNHVQVSGNVPFVDATPLDPTMGYVVKFAADYTWSPARDLPYATDTSTKTAIDWAGYAAWQKVSDFEVTLYDAYASIEVGGMWSLNFTTNSFVLGESIPPFDQGASKQVNPYSLGGQFYNLNNYMDTYANGNGQMSLNGFEEARGNYFSFGFYGSNVNEWAKIFSIEPRYIGIKSTPMGTNN